MVIKSRLNMDIARDYCSIAPISLKIFKGKISILLIPSWAVASNAPVYS